MSLHLREQYSFRLSISKYKSHTTHLQYACIVDFLRLIPLFAIITMFTPTKVSK